MSVATIRRSCTVLLAGAMLLVVTACGSDSDSTATDEPTAPAASSTGATDSAPASAAPDGPACAEVWVEGATLDKKYAGCVDDTGLVAPHKLGCSSGQTFVLYGDQFWAVKGGVVKYAAGGRTDAKPYLVDMAACRG